MRDLRQLIRAAAASTDAIPRQHVRQWIAGADSVAVDALLYELTRDAWHRIEPSLERHETCAFIQRYLLRCVREDPADGVALTRFEAAAVLEQWFSQLAACEDTVALAQGVAAAVTDLFLDSDSRTRNAIETGFLEHVLEQRSLRGLFAHWQHDDRLHDAWRHATAWADAHPIS